jgi:lipoprotein-anchoring transpeptidase ErfK/SrfK
MEKIKKVANIILILLAISVMIVFTDRIIPLNETYGLPSKTLEDMNKVYKEIVNDNRSVKDKETYPYITMEEKLLGQETDCTVPDGTGVNEGRGDSLTVSGGYFLESSKNQGKEENAEIGFTGVADSYNNSTSVNDEKMEDSLEPRDEEKIDFGDVENIKVEVDLENQKVIIFYRGRAVREMICSGGTPESPSPTGEFTTLEKIDYSWVERFDMGAYYWVRFFEDYLFHSVPFDKNGEMIIEEFEKLGEPASHGCIRLGLDEAKWFYETIPLGVKVLIH